MSAPDRRTTEDTETLNVRIPVIGARTIDDDSWLQGNEHASFRAAYAYASTQMLAIPALAAVSPEDIFFAHEALKRGEKSFTNQRGERRPLPGPTGVEQVGTDG